jgi:hypothetical protein
VGVFSLSHGTLRTGARLSDIQMQCIVPPLPIRNSEFRAPATHELKECNDMGSSLFLFSLSRGDNFSSAYGVEYIVFGTAGAGFWGRRSSAIFSGLQGVESSGRSRRQASRFLCGLPALPVPSAPQQSREPGRAGHRDNSAPLPLQVDRYGSCTLPLLPAWMPGAQRESFSLRPARWGCKI